VIADSDMGFAMQLFHIMQASGLRIDAVLMRTLFRVAIAGNDEAVFGSLVAFVLENKIQLLPSTFMAVNEHLYSRSGRTLPVRFKGKKAHRFPARRQFQREQEQQLLDEQQTAESQTMRNAV